MKPIAVPRHGTRFAIRAFHHPLTKDIQVTKTNFQSITNITQNCEKSHILPLPE